MKTVKPSSNSLTDQLALAAPGLYRHLCVAFDADAVASLELAYQIGARAGTLQEPDLIRSAESSFNPRPARLAVIILTENPSASVQLIQAAFLLHACPQTLPERLVAASAITETVSHALRDYWQIAAVPTQLEESALCLFLADCLDFFRHLHMLNLAHTIKQDYYSRAAVLNFPHLQTASAKRLVERIGHWHVSQRTRYALTHC